MVTEEKTNQYKRRDFATYPGIAMIAALLAYRYANPNSDIVLDIFILVTSLYIYFLFVYTTLLGLKADAYIRVFIEAEIPCLNWYTLKKDFGIGWIRKCYRWVITGLFMSPLIASVYILVKEGSISRAIFLGIPAFVLFLLAATKHHNKDYSSLVNIWNRKKSTLAESEKMKV